MNVKLFSTTPSKKDVFWQVVLLPTITILRNTDFGQSYTVLSFEWLFWSVTTILNDSKG